MAANAPATFISYCRADSDFALHLAEDLKAASANVWIDQLDIEPGSRWDRAVQEAAANCPRMLVLLTPESVESENVLDEINFALDKRKTIIPVLYRDCETPLRLRRVQHIDFRADYQRGLRTLLKALDAQQTRAAIAPLSGPTTDSTPAPAEQPQQTAVQAAVQEPRQQAAEKACQEHERERPEQLRLEAGRRALPRRQPAQRAGISVSKDPRGSNRGLKFVSIGIHHRSDKYWREGERSEHRSKISNKAAQYFHMTVFESDSDFWKEHRDPVNADPLFDITVKNESGRSLIFRKVGVVISAVANSNYLWGIPTAVRIPVSANYAVDVPNLRERFQDAYDGFELKPKRLDEVVWKRVPDTYALEPEAPFRYTLRLKNYCENMPNHARLQMWCETDHGEFRSGEIALLRY